MAALVVLLLNISEPARGFNGPVSTKGWPPGLITLMQLLLAVMLMVLATVTKPVPGDDQAAAGQVDRAQAQRRRSGEGHCTVADDQAAGFIVLDVQIQSAETVHHQRTAAQPGCRR